jgi:hypothetical protein
MGWMRLGCGRGGCRCGGFLSRSSEITRQGRHIRFQLQTVSRETQADQATSEHRRRTIPTASNPLPLRCGRARPVLTGKLVRSGATNVIVATRAGST